MSLSPQIITKEKDFSQSVATPTTGIVGYCGVFTKGPIFEITTITNERELVSTFGKPTSTNYKHFFSCKAILDYSNSLKIVRAVNDDDDTLVTQAQNAGMVIDETTGGPTSTSDYIEDYSNYTATFTGDETLKIFAANPGAWGNNIKIAIATYSDFDTAEYLSGALFNTQIEYGPAASDEIAIIVIDDTDGDDTVVEKYVVSMTDGSKDASGNSNFIEDVINGNSAYIIAFSKSGATTADSFSGSNMGSGVDGDAPDSGDIQRGYDLFDDKENVDINYLMSGGNETDVLRKYIDTIAQSRKDIMGFISSKQADIVGISSTSTIVSNLTTDIETLAINSSYTTYYGNYVYIYDAYNDKFRFVPIVGYILGNHIAQTANNEVWFSTAGYNRGILSSSIIKLGFSPNLSQRDTLYKNRINPIFTSKDGHVSIGQKSLLNSTSSFNRNNIRLLFIYIESAISDFAKSIIGEMNDTITRNLFTVQVEAFLDTIVAGRGLQDYAVRCDTSNNTSTVIDNNEFIAEIGLKPSKVSEVITLSFYNTPTGVDFSEIFG